MTRMGVPRAGRPFYIWLLMPTLSSVLIAAALAAGALSCSHLVPGSPVATIAPESGERHLRNLRQLTNGGENAEAYFSGDGRRLIFQSTRDGRSCDQEYIMNIDGTGVRRVSTGTGKTTCGFFYANDHRILFGSSHSEQKDACCSALMKKRNCKLSCSPRANCRLPSRQKPPRRSLRLPL